MNTKKINALSMRDRIALLRWLEDHRPKIESGRWSRANTARLAQRDLQMPVTVGNLKGLESVAGVSFNARRGPSKGARTADRLDRIEKYLGLAPLGQEVDTEA